MFQQIGIQVRRAASGCSFGVWLPTNGQWQRGQVTLHQSRAPGDGKKQFRWSPPERCNSKSHPTSACQPESVGRRCLHRCASIAVQHHQATVTPYFGGSAQVFVLLFLHVLYSTVHFAVHQLLHLTSTYFFSVGFSSISASWGIDATSPTSFLFFSCPPFHSKDIIICPFSFPFSQYLHAVFQLTVHGLNLAPIPATSHWVLPL